MEGKQKNLRKGRWSVSGGYYFITICAFDYSIRFDTKPIADILFNFLQWMETNKKFETHACMIMPDHIHLVFHLMDDSLAKTMKIFKGYTAREFNKFMDRTGSVYQEQYYDHFIRDDESLENIILYCYWNPVRKNLVESPEEWPFWYCKYDL